MASNGKKLYYWSFFALMGSSETFGHALLHRTTLRKILMFINQCHTKQFTCRAVVTAHFVVSSSKVNFAAHSDHVCYEIAEDASLLVCDAM